MTFDSLRHLIDAVFALDVHGGHHAIAGDDLVDSLLSGGAVDAHHIEALLTQLSAHELEAARAALIDAFAHHGGHGPEAALDPACVHHHPMAAGLDAHHALPGGYYNADGTYHYTSDNTDRDPSTGAIIRRW
jgi:hypothetical protein